ncbi:MAG: hypothetical protein MJ177_02945 [Clostridia bacterium]|nr:hypothetical protein [Clostridia bacterium]
MKKLIAVLLTVLMLVSACGMALVACAEEDIQPGQEEVIDDGTQESTGIDLSEYPDWLVELIERLVQVFTKLLIKFGIKLQLKSIF